MTQKISLLTLSVIAAAALVAERAVGRDGNYAAAGGNAFGVTNTSGAIGDRVPVDALGTTIATAGGAFDDGDFLEVGSNGKLVVLDDGIAVAQALQDAAADGDRVEVLWIPNVPAPAAP
ncbi:MAG: capsid cement protein [Stenotrophomonas sp.]